MTDEQIAARISALEAARTAIIMQIMKKHRPTVIDAMDMAQAAQNVMPAGDWRIRRIAEETRPIDDEIRALKQLLRN